MQRNVHIKPNPFYKLWNSYCKYIETVLQPPAFNQQNNPDYLSNRLFTHAIIYGLPVAFIALIPTVYAAIRNNNVFMVLFGIGIVTAVACVSLIKGIAMFYRKLAVSAALVITAIVLIVIRGDLGIGCVYLLTFSVFYALHFSDVMAKRAVFINALICLVFSLVITFHLLHTKAIIFEWIIQSVNFLFLNIVIIAMIRFTINRLERTMRAETDIYQRLQNEFKEKQILNDNLLESENRYKTLFSYSPSAKLIFDVDSLFFLETNQAATEIYGYSTREFINMRLTDIHLSNDVPELLGHLFIDNKHEDLHFPIRSRHVKKDGSIIDVELLRSDITFKGRRARIIVVNDITLEVEHVSAIKRQNNTLKEIAYVQAHLVRQPLTKVMALTDLIADEFNGHGDQDLIRALSQSSLELDSMIREIIDKSAHVLDELEGRVEGDL